MLKVMPAPALFVDVGSTMIKAVLARDGVAETNFFRQRSQDPPLAQQVQAFLDECSGSTTRLRLCSSANGGLRVGLLCLTKRFSGASAMHMLEVVGANIRYLYELREFDSVSQAPPVDVLVIVGGAEGFSQRHIEAQVRRLDLGRFPHDRLLYAGHVGIAEVVRQRWPHAVRIANPLGAKLDTSGVDLAEHARLHYLDDIASKRDLLPLLERAAQPIEPTPAIVSRAFQRLVGRWVTPALLLDVGGATTDLHYTKELVDEERIAGNLSAYGLVNRHVYTGYGVYESETSLLRALASHPRCADFIEAYDGRNWRHLYAGVQEGQAIDAGLNFYACIFLALADTLATDEAKRLPDASPPLLLERLATVAVTGGAAKVVQPDILRRVVASVVGTSLTMQFLIDRAYRWWIMGLMPDEEINEITWRSLDAEG